MKKIFPMLSSIFLLVVLSVTISNSWAEATDHSNGQKASISFRVQAIENKANQYSVECSIYRFVDGGMQDFGDAEILLNGEPMVHIFGGRFRSSKLTFQSGDQISVKILDSFLGEIEETLTIPPAIDQIIADVELKDFAEEVVDSITVNWNHVGSTGYAVSFTKYYGGKLLSTTLIPTEKQTFTFSNEILHEDGRGEIKGVKIRAIAINSISFETSTAHVNFYVEGPYSCSLSLD